MHASQAPKAAAGGARPKSGSGKAGAALYDVEDYSAILLRLKSGRSVILESGWAAFIPPDRREYGIDLLGTRGGLSLFPGRFFRNGKDGYETVGLDGAKASLTEDRVHYFVACALDGQKPLITPDQCLKVQRVIDAIYASAKAKKEVRLG
jgi:predicted dehydrogenase